MSSYLLPPDHKWRLLAPADDMEPAIELAQLCPDQIVDHWFDEEDLSVFSGNGEQPVSLHITEIACYFCGAAGCPGCCGTGTLLMWVEVPATALVIGLKTLLVELEQLPLDEAA